MYRKISLNIFQNRATNSIHNDTRITIELIDENDEIPMFVGLDENGRYSGSVPENSEPGTSVIRVTATDRDALKEYSEVTGLNLLGGVK